MSSFFGGLEYSDATKAGSHMRLIDSCITQLKAQGYARACDESKEEERKLASARPDTNTTYSSTIVVVN